MLQMRAANSSIRPWHSFEIDVDTGTGVVLVAPASYLAAQGIRSPEGASSIRAVNLRPGTYIVWSPQTPDNCVARITTGDDGTVLVGCPAMIAGGIGVEAYNQWMIETDFLRRGDGTDYLVIDIPPAGRSVQFDLCFVNDPA